MNFVYIDGVTVWIILIISFEKTSISIIDEVRINSK